MSAMAGAGRAPAADSKIKGLRIDWLLVLSASILMLVGLMSLYSEGWHKEHGGNFGKQVFNIVVGIVPFTFFLLVHPKMFKKYSRAIYIGNLVILALVLKLGFHEMGAQRWITLGPIRFEPSELAKLFIVFTLASFFADRQDSIRKFSTFALSFAHVAVPSALIFEQPHLGAALVMLAIWLAISITAEVPIQFVLGFIAGGLLLFGLVWATPGVLNDYQRKRVEGLLHKNEKDSGYQTLRSEIAFGSGGVLGEGYLRGEQKQARFIPEQHNDFIFTVVGEEGGLVGCTLVLLAYGFFFFRAWLVMLDATDPYYKMLIAGVIGLLAFHMTVNLGMILQLLPVVGLWLPFLSYGGTAMWLCMSCVALLLNIRRHERPVLFS